MTKRDKTLNAIMRKGKGYVPYHFELCPSLLERFRELNGRSDYMDYYDMPFYFVYVQAHGNGGDFLKYFDRLKENTYINEFGVAFEPSDTEHFTQMRFPMRNFSEISEFESYPYPDPAHGYDWNGLKSDVERIKASDRLAVGGLAMTVFEIGWYMRGMENFLMDMLTGEQTLKYHIQRITEIRCEQAKRFAAAGVDVLHLGDDIATQQSMMFSVSDYRKWIKSAHRAVVEAARSVNPDIIIDYHSDGNCFDAIEDLIDIGVQILNPVQPECMDPLKVKEAYGNRLAMRGTLGTQTTLPFGKPEDVRREALRMIDKAGYDGGLILAPSHMLEPEVPWENIQALIDTMEEYNKSFD